MLARFDYSSPDMLARFARSRDAASLSALGAAKGGTERAKSLTKKERSTIAQKAAKTRWKV